MTLYYNKDSYEIRDLSDSLIVGWNENNNPKRDQWQILPPRPSDNHLWVNGSWVYQELINQQILTATQIRLWLFNNNISLETVDSAINNISDQLIRETTRIQWEYGIEITKNHPILPVISHILNLSEIDIDTLFLEAQVL